MKAPCARSAAQSGVIDAIPLPSGTFARPVVATCRLPSHVCFKRTPATAETTIDSTITTVNTLLIALSKVTGRKGQNIFSFLNVSTILTIRAPEPLRTVYGNLNSRKDPLLSLRLLCTSLSVLIQLFRILCIFRWRRRRPENARWPLL